MVLVLSGGHPSRVHCWATTRLRPRLQPLSTGARVRCMCIRMRVYVCMYVCMYVSWGVYVCVSVWARRVRVWVQEYVCVCVCMCELLSRHEERERCGLRV